MQLLKKKPPQAINMQIGWMENYFRDLSAKVWANLDNPIKSYDFQSFDYFLYAALSGGPLLQAVMYQHILKLPRGTAWKIWFD